jgi:hypothetical protein
MNFHSFLTATSYKRGRLGRFFSSVIWFRLIWGLPGGAWRAIAFPSRTLRTRREKGQQNDFNLIRKLNVIERLIFIRPESGAPEF